jgi:ankyrin repeat protein
MKPQDINSREWASGFTPLHVCVSGTDSVDRQEIIKLLHAAGADINCKDLEKGLAPLHYTALRNKPLCMKTLISLGADLHITEVNGATALHGAAYHGNLDAVKVLMEAGADPNKQDNFGNTPLSLAQRTNNASIIALLSAKHS